MNLLKLPRLKVDKNNKFLIDLVNKLNNILSSFERTLQNLTYIVDAIDNDINTINENYVKRLELQPYKITGQNFNNNSYIIDNDNAYFVNINIDLYPNASDFSVSSNEQLCKFMTNLDLTNHQNLQFITYKDGSTPNIYNLSIGQDNILYSGDNGASCNQYKTAKIFGTIIIDKAKWV